MSDMQNAKTYNDATDYSLQEILITAKAIAQTINKYHAFGYLHFDIKPQNILVLPETRELVKLLDFDSMIKMTDAANHD